MKQDLKTSTSSAVVLASLQKKSKPLLHKLQSCEVLDNDSYSATATQVAQLKAIKKEASAQLATIHDPLKQAIKAANEIFKPFLDLVDETEYEAKRRMMLFVNKREDDFKKLESDFGNGKIKKVSTLLGKRQELSISSDSASIRTISVLEVTDRNKVPRKYLVPDTSAITADLKAGKKVAGCKLVNQKSIAI